MSDATIVQSIDEEIKHGKAPPHVYLRKAYWLRYMGKYDEAYDAITLAIEKVQTLGLCGKFGYISEFFVEEARIHVHLGNYEKVLETLEKIEPSMFLVLSHSGTDGVQQDLRCDVAEILTHEDVSKLLQEKLKLGECSAKIATIARCVDKMREIDSMLGNIS